MSLSRTLLFTLFVLYRRYAPFHVATASLRFTTPSLLVSR